MVNGQIFIAELIEQLVLSAGVLLHGQQVEIEIEFFIQKSQRLQDGFVVEVRGKVEGDFCPKTHAGEVSFLPDPQKVAAEGGRALEGHIFQVGILEFFLELPVVINGQQAAGLGVGQGGDGAAEG